jgi:outer membrane protein assembly factor BamB
VVSGGGGHRHYVQLTGSGVIGVDPKSGKLLWRVPGEGYSTAVIPTAVVQGDHVFATTSYGAKCMLIKLAADGAGKVKAEKVYSNKNLENHHGGVLLVDDRLYGSHGNANNKKTLPFVCLNFPTGDVILKEAGKLEPSGIAFADGHIFCFGQQTGALVRLKATATGYAEDGKFTIPQETERRQPAGAIWTHPVIANGRLLLRDQDLIFCYDLRPGTAAE